MPRIWLLLSVCARLPQALHLQQTSGSQPIRAETGGDAELSDGFAVVVPGFGKSERVELLRRNVAWLRGQGMDFDCFIFVYRSEADFPLDPTQFEPCRLIRHPGYWMDHMLALPLSMSPRRWVVHMMDSVEPAPNLNLTRLVDIMQANKLEHVSPTMLEDAHYPVMRAQNGSGSVGRRVGFIELNFDVFSHRYFECMRGSIYPDNKLGWGVDFVLPQLCNGSLGVLDHMWFSKRFTGSYNSRRAYFDMRRYISRYRDLRLPRNLTSLGDRLSIGELK